MISIATKCLRFLIGLLPNDPIKDAILESLNSISAWMGYINYFIPFTQLAIMLGLWLGALLSYYVYIQLKPYVMAILQKILLGKIFK